MIHRCQIPAWAERWMQGDRFGELVSAAKGIATVKLDISGRTVRFMFCDLEAAWSEPRQTRGT